MGRFIAHVHVYNYHVHVHVYCIIIIHLYMEAVYVHQLELQKINACARTFKCNFLGAIFRKSKITHTCVHVQCTYISILKVINESLINTILPRPSYKKG